MLFKNPRFAVGAFALGLVALVPAAAYADTKDTPETSAGYSTTELKNPFSSSDLTIDDHNAEVTVGGGTSSQGQRIGSIQVDANKKWLLGYQDRDGFSLGFVLDPALHLNLQGSQPQGSSPGVDNSRVDIEATGFTGFRLYGDNRGYDDSDKPSASGALELAKVSYLYDNDAAVGKKINGVHLAGLGGSNEDAFKFEGVPMDVCFAADVGGILGKVQTLTSNDSTALAANGKACIGAHLGQVGRLGYTATASYALSDMHQNAKGHMTEPNMNQTLDIEQSVSLSHIAKTPLEVKYTHDDEYSTATAGTRAISTNIFSAGGAF